MLLFFQHGDSEEYWEKLVQESDPTRQQKDLLNYSAIISELKSKALAFKDQVMGCHFQLIVKWLYLETIVHLVSFVGLAHRWRCKRSVADLQTTEGLTQPDSDL